MHEVRGGHIYAMGLLLCQALVPDPVETEVNRETKIFFSHGADILEQRKTFKKINKMCFLLHVDKRCREN